MTQSDTHYLMEMSSMVVEMSLNASIRDCFDRVLSAIFEQNNRGN